MELSSINTVCGNHLVIQLVNKGNLYNARETGLVSICGKSEEVKSMDIIEVWEGWRDD